MKKSQGFHAKITKRFALLFSAALLSFLLAIVPMIVKSLNAELEMTAQERLNLMSYQLSDSLEEVRATWFSIVRDSTLQQLMREYPQHTQDSNYTLQIRNRLKQLTMSSAAIRSAIMIAPDHTVLDPIYGTDPYAQLLIEQSEFDKYQDSQLFAYFSAANTFPYIYTMPATSNERNTITFLGCFFDDTTYEPLGTVAINYTKSSFFNTSASSFPEGFENIFIVDSDGRVIVDFLEERSQVSASLLAAESGNMVLDGTDLIAVIKSPLAAYPSWTLCSALDMRMIKQPIYTLLLLMSVIACFVLSAVVITSSRLARHATVPLRCIMQAMERVKEGIWQKVEVIPTQDEFEKLMSGYNDMVNSLEELTNRLADEKNQKNSIQIAMLQSRLDMLQSQINPHFIHNTLNAINYLAQKEGAMELSRLIVSFNGLLRTSMSTTNMFCTVAEEVENIRRFIHIHQVRYDMEITCIYRVEPEAESLIIPKLILQPLVENSLLHGILPHGGGQIIIQIAVSDHRLWISVVDNGAGIPTERLEHLLSGADKNPRGYSSIGLSNVSDRLILTYGKTSCPVVQSQEGVGTAISFSIPLETEQGDPDILPDDV